MSDTLKLASLSKGQLLIASYCTHFLKPEMRHIYRQIKGVKGFEMFVIAKERLNTEQFPHSDVEVLESVPLSPLRRAFAKYVRRAPALIYRGEYEGLRRILLRRNPGLIHVYFGNTAVHLLPFLRIWDRPSVVSFHGMDVQSRPWEKGYSRRLQETLNVATLVLVRSESLKLSLQKLGCDPQKIRLNRTGIPIDEFPYCERVLPEAGEWIVTQACRLIPKKGLVTSLKAFQRFLSHYPRAQFFIAGEGPLRDTLREQITALGLGHSVVLTGFLAQPELNRLFRRSHLFLHPSELTADLNQEGVPNSMLEAMATGLPVIATRHGGIPEAVHEGVVGFLLDERDDKAIGEAMLRVTQSPELWRYLSQGARAVASSEFDREAQSKVLENIYFESIDLWPRAKMR